MLLECLNAVDNAGTFVYGDLLKDAPNPGLLSEGYHGMRFTLGPGNVRIIQEANSLRLLYTMKQAAT